MARLQQRGSSASGQQAVGPLDKHIQRVLVCSSSQQK